MLKYIALYMNDNKRIIAFPGRDVDPLKGAVNGYLALYPIKTL